MNKNSRKNLVRMLAFLLACVLLTGCGAAGSGVDAAVPSPAAEAPAAGGKEAIPPEEANRVYAIEEKQVPAYICSLDEQLTEPYPLYFVNGVEDLPYVELREWAEILYFMNREYAGDTGYELTYFEQESGIVLERENGYSLEFDFINDRLIFDDYDAFIHNSSDTTLIDLLSESGFDENGEAELFQRDTRASFDRNGDLMTVELGSYGIRMIAQDGKYYVPLQTMNDFLISPMKTSFLYNGEALILANDEDLFDYEKGEYTELAGFYYEAEPRQRSDELAAYSYNELCLVMDTFYGLKEPHEIRSFRQLFWEIAFDEPLSGNDPAEADRALKAFIDYYLDDLHSVFNEFSWMAGLDSISDSTGLANRKFDEHSKTFAEARDRYYPDGCPGYEEVGNTAYITFDTFTSDYAGKAFYSSLKTGEIPDDTLGLIIYAHSRITREGSPIENVVLDLSNNTGGAVDAAVFVLGWFLGDAPFSVKNTATGATSTSVYRADVNLDRHFDEKDTVQDRNLYCLISPVSFSCGNLVPAVLKSSQKVTLLGRTSGGGSCVVQPLSTAYGSVFQISSAMRLSFLKNGSFYDIDQGVDPDYYINRIQDYYDREALTAYINALV